MRSILAAIALLALSVSAQAQCVPITEIVAHVSAAPTHGGNVLLNAEQIERAKKWMIDYGSSLPPFDVALLVLRTDGIVIIFIGTGKGLCGYVMYAPSSAESLINAVFSTSL